MPDSALLYDVLLGRRNGLSPGGALAETWSVLRMRTTCVPFVNSAATDFLRFTSSHSNFEKFSLLL